MIMIKLLGGAKRALGRDRLEIDVTGAKLRDVMQTLRSMSRDARIFDDSNLLIVVNGVESSVLGGLDAGLKDGDVVNIVPVVHGG